ncbi:DUF4062 domain-containing protein [Acinetobacter soli]|uniref:DUF4062 domain-containing protein n=3 Tax=Acinetobacter soli TaxID=487316 RepID=UPI00125D1B1E|nr:DUF4062 domain-containing protein [Acinetobacter soli]
MPQQQVILNVFLASPSDVSSEREVIQNIINELNKTWSKNLNLRLELLRWETDVVPSFGESPQDVINQQIGSDYDIFIGLLWSRFGMPTKDYESGTEEEFYRAYELYNKGKDIDLLIYFKNDPISLEDIDPHQIQKIKAFKQTMQNLGGIYGITSDDNFEGKLRSHLSIIIQKWKDRLLRNNKKEILYPTNLIGNSYISETITEEQDIEDEEGIIDLDEKAKEALAKCESIMNNIAEDLAEFSRTTSSYTEQVTQLTAAKASVTTLKFSINQFSKVIYDFSSNLDSLGKEYKVHTNLSIDSLTKLLVIYADSGNSQDAILEIITASTTLTNSVETVLPATIEFLDTVKNMPRMTTELNRSKKVLIKSLEQLVSYLQDTYAQYKEISEFKFSK